MSSDDTATINITAVNDAPTLTTMAAPVVSVNEDAQATITLANLQAQGNEADVDGTVTAFVVKTVSSGTLLIGTSAGTATAWAAGTNDTVDATRQAYWTAAPDANGTLNAFTVVAKDNGGLESAAPVQVQVSVTAVNDAPVVTTSGSTLPYTENGAATAVDSGLTVSDADNANLSSATVTISSGFATAEDTLAFTDQNGITGSWNSGTGVLTLNGSATVANYQAALRSITYVNTSDDPSTATRTVSFVVNDGSANSNTGTRNISVAAVNDAPAVTTTGTTLAYTENGAATAVDSGLTVSDADNANLSSATVTISANFATSEDTLAFADQNGITASWNSGTGAMTLTGSATAANYQTALRSHHLRQHQRQPEHGDPHGQLRRQR